MSDTQRISELLATRLCHDLTGPIGAVNNGVEFLEDDPSMQESAMELITQSSQEAIARLQFFRQAYGHIRHTGEVSLTDRKQLFEQFFKHSKLELDWPDSHTDAAGLSISYKMARLMMNMTIILSGVMIRGGAVHIRLNETEDEQVLSLIGESEHIKDDIDMERALAHEMDVDELTPKLVQPYLAGALAREIGCVLTFEHKDNKVEFTAQKQK